jgi:uncharacterized protein (DUF2237 family)
MTVFNKIQGTSVTSFRIGLTGPTIYTGTADPTVMPPIPLADGLKDGDMYIRTSGSASTIWVRAGTVFVPLAISGGGGIFLNDIVMSAGTQILGDPSATESAPSFAFDGDDDTGMFLNSADELSFSAGGSEIIRISAAGLEALIGQIIAGASSETVPGFTFTGDLDTGIFQDSADELAITVGGSETVRISAAGLETTTGQFIAGASSETAPGFTFTGDLNTGIFQDSADELAVTVGGSETVKIDSTAITAATNINFVVSGTGELLGLPATPSGATAATSKAYVDSVISGNGPFIAVDGTIAAPAFSFTADTNTGFYRIGSGNTGYSADGVNVLSMGSANITSAVPFFVPDGTVGAPAFSFTSEPDTGMFLLSPGNLGLTVNGVQLANFDADRAAFVQQVRVLPANQSVAGPAFSFVGDADTGMYQDGANVIGFSTGGVNVLSMSSTDITSAVPYLAPDGTALAPAFSFTSDPNTGLFLDNPDELAITIGGSETIKFNSTAITAAANINFVVSGTGELLGLPATPSGATAAASKAYVDTFASGNGPFIAVDGTVAAPAFSFTLDSNTGFYRIGSGNTGYSADGVNVLSMASTAITAAANIDFVVSGGGELLGLPATPSGATAAASKAYVDSITSGSVTLLAPDGTVGAPSFSFDADPDTGFYRIGSGNTGYSADGVNVLSMASTDITSAVPFFVPNGTVGAPTFAFTGDSNTGMYHVSPDVIGFSTGGVGRISISAAGLEAIAGQIIASASSAAVPGFTFTGDLDTGLFQDSADELAITIGGSETIKFNSTAITAAANIDFVVSGGGELLGLPATPSGATAAASKAYVDDVTSGSVPYLALDGTVAAPAFSFTLDSNTGFYRIGSGNTGYSADGVNVLSMSSTAITAASNIDFVVQGGGELLGLPATPSGATAAASKAYVDDATSGSVPYLALDGTVAAPAFSFTADTNTGFYRIGSGNTGYSADGVNVLSMGSANITSAVPYLAPNGTALAPAFSFTTDPNTGIFQNGADQIGFSTGGVGRWEVDATGHFVPVLDDTYNIGEALTRVATVYATTFDGTATAAKYSDLAERYSVKMGCTLNAGDIVCISESEDYDICISSSIADDRVLGVVSTAPGFMMNKDAGTNETAPYIALRGRVPVKVVGKVRKGDLLVSSDVQGHAKALCTHQEKVSTNPHAVFGKALSSFDDEFDHYGIIEAVIL